MTYNAKELLESVPFTHTVFLSEFDDAHPIRKTETWWWVILVAEMFALAVLGLGHICKSNALFVKITPILSSPASIEVLPSAIWWRGYLAELNHGLCYVFIVPLCLFLLVEFLKRADYGMRALQVSRDLTEECINDLKNRNINFFAPNGNNLLWVLIGVMILWNAGNEFLERMAATCDGGTSECIGYAQRPYFYRWSDSFVHASSGEKFEKLKNLKISNTLEHILSERILHPESEWAKVWISKNLITYLDRPIDEEEFHYRIARKDPLHLEIDKACEAEVLSFAMGSNSTYLNSNEKIIHWLFMLLIVVMEGTVHGLGLWLLAKVCFWFYQTQRLLPKELPPSENEDRLRITFDDPSKSYGLRPLHAVYNVVAYLLVCISFVFISQYLNELGNGLINPLNFECNWQTFSAILLGGSVIIALLSVFLNIFVSTLKMDQLEKKRRTQLYHLVASEESAPAAREELSSIDEQFTWPINDKRFISSLLLAISLALVPLLPIIRDTETPVSSELQNASLVHNTVKECVDSICSSYCNAFYGEKFSVK